MTETAISQKTASMQRLIGCTGVNPYLQLVKLPLSATIAASALAGYLLQTPRLDLASIIVSLSILLLACGCAALNNFQDRHLDGCFTRTRRRPLPTGGISPERALATALILVIGGLAGLLWQPYPVLYLGGFAVICYNGLYTPLKRLTVWAMLPGAICGMLPPWMGWLAGGGPPLSLQIILVMTIFGVWQMPHFWLILLTNAEDYQRTDLPNPLTNLTQSQLERVLLVWVIALGTLMLCLPLVRLIQTPLGLAALLLNITVLVGFFLLHHHSNKNQPAYRTLFARLNLAVFVSLAIVICERVLYT